MRIASLSLATLLLAGCVRAIPYAAATAFQDEVSFEEPSDALEINGDGSFLVASDAQRMPNEESRTKYYCPLDKPWLGCCPNGVNEYGRGRCTSYQWLFGPLRCNDPPRWYCCSEIANDVSYSFLSLMSLWG